MQMVVLLLLRTYRQQTEKAFAFSLLLSAVGVLLLIFVTQIQPGVFVFNLRC